MCHLFSTVHSTVCTLSRCLTVLPFRRYIRVAVLPCSETTRCLFRTRGSLPQDAVEVNEVFGIQMAHNVLRQKTLRVDVCHTSPSGREECLVSLTTHICKLASTKQIVLITSTPIYSRNTATHGGVFAMCTSKSQCIPFKLPHLLLLNHMTVVYCHK